MILPDIQFIIDTSGYIRKIDAIVEKTGRYDIALRKIMMDINFFKNKLKYVNHYNWNKLCDKINQLVIEYGEVDQNLHYFRNLLNRVPQNLNEMILLNKNLPKSLKWKLVEPEKSLFHMYGEGGEFNLKFVSHDGKFEAVYNKKGELLTERNDPINMGTYNYANPDDAARHMIYDVVPYLKWGNTRKSGVPQLSEVEKNLVKFDKSKSAKIHYEKIQKELE